MSLTPFPTAVSGSLYARAVYFTMTVAIFGQGSSTVFVVGGPAVFSLWLYVCASLVSEPDVCPSILRRQVGLGMYCLVGQMGMEVV